MGRGGAGSMDYGTMVVIRTFAGSHLRFSLHAGQVYCVTGYFAKWSLTILGSLLITSSPERKKVSISQLQV